MNRWIEYSQVSLPSSTRVSRLEKTRVIRAERGRISAREMIYKDRGRELLESVL